MAGTDDIQDMLNSFVSNTSKLLYQVGDTLREQAVKSKDLVEEKLKERELSLQLAAFGKDVFALYADEKLELPDSLDEHLEKIKALVKEIADLQAHEASKRKDAETDEAAEEEPAKEPVSADDADDADDAEDAEDAD